MPYGAWNRKRKVWVKWLGYACTGGKMASRLRKYDAPKHVRTKTIPSSTFAKWGKKDRCRRS